MLKLNIFSDLITYILISKFNVKLIISITDLLKIENEDKEKITKDMKYEMVDGVSKLVSKDYSNALHEQVIIFFLMNRF